MSKILLEIINLKKSFDHRGKTIELFNNVNLKVREGDLIALVGPSGSGKSSFLHMLALLDDPTKGKVILDNKNTKNLKDEKKDQIRREKISIIFQDNNLLSDFTAFENIIMPLIIKNERSDDAIKKVNNVLKEVKIFDRKNHFPNELSGGEQQRVAVARALINSPKILFADEPSGNLDSKSAKILHNLFFDLRKKMDLTVVIITHNKELSQMTDRKLSLIDGKWSE